MTVNGYTPNKIDDNIYEYINVEDGDVDNIISTLRERIINVDIEADELINGLWRIRYFINS